MTINLTNAQRSGFIAQRHLIVYRAKMDYMECVSVVLSNDKKMVVSYPDPSDIRAGGSRFLPIVLHKGYLLSNYGISKNSAFLKLTFLEYGALQSAPSLEEFYNMIADKNPIKFLCDCGVAKNYGNAENELNEMIDKGLLKKKCKIIRK